ncbi:sigma-54 dependent transcriptional regulator [Myxococcus sp. K38C18041901]|uniref:sigma-54 interaction domain-containing protein n=1 Tax=Myxococcus guangdongensis TaxID=2906760 RepID=UPI0020A81A4E|nr:sigma-54 dependent transcriptional regulator [Myxococcus guangdongensis]MCP3065417.1 sigma-54 dependent transcriptional regulator [Myxococcus guangdongensis]
MRNILLAWIGKDDHEAARDAPGKVSRLAAAVSSRSITFDEVVIVNDLKKKDAEEWLATTLKPRARAELRLCHHQLKSPVDYESIYRGALAAIRETLERHGPHTRLHFLLNSGTEAMGAVWLLVGKSRYPATLVAVAKESQQLVEVPVPFNLAAEFLPEVLRADAPSLEQVLGDRAPPSSAFKDIRGTSAAIRAALDQARLYAAGPPYPVLIEGETGTGKEMFASAIHAGSPRRTGPYLPLNCGALAKELIESELFGHEKGAFTGAQEKKPGAFRTANGGTLFLDEVGELPLEAQVKLLRVLEVGKVRSVGGTKEETIDVRIIAATHRNLLDQVACGQFREDLYYRLAVGTLFLPPLRERTGDIGELIDVLMRRTNEDLQKVGLPSKELSTGARPLLLGHSWPGNVRELLNTLKRCAMLTPGPLIDEVVAGAAIRPGAKKNRLALDPDGPLPEGFELPMLLASVEAAYIQKALEQCGKNKSRAAALLGLNSRQTMDNRLEAAERLLKHHARVTP